jgi:hypothetical protein
VGLAKKAREAWEWMKLGRLAGKLRGAMSEADQANGYSAGTTAKKVAVALGQYLGSAAAVAAADAVLVALSNESAVGAVLDVAGIPPDVKRPLTLLIFAVVVGINNYRKNRNK